jgi:KDO2-lipid IV(A) lauroyltransferase
MNAVARLVLGFLWLLSWLPLAVQAAIGRGLGRLLWLLAGSRRRVALRNLELTMPEKTPAQREAIAHENFQWIARSFLERGLLWYASPQRLRRLIRVEGDPGFAEREEGAVMWLAPHFVALDVAGQATQLFQNRPVGSIYQKQSIAAFDKAIRAGRVRCR